MNARNHNLAAAPETEEKKESGKDKVMSVRVSTETHKKATQLYKLLKYSAAKPSWGKDQKLLKYNLLKVPNSKNYTVLLALGRGPIVSDEE